MFGVGNFIQSRHSCKKDFWPSTFKVWMYFRLVKYTVALISITYSYHIVEVINNIEQKNIWTLPKGSFWDAGSHEHSKFHDILQSISFLILTLLTFPHNRRDWMLAVWAKYVISSRYKINMGYALVMYLCVINNNSSWLEGHPLGRLTGAFSTT